MSGDSHEIPRYESYRHLLIFLRDINPNFYSTEINTEQEDTIHIYCEPEGVDELEVVVELPNPVQIGELILFTELHFIPRST